MKVLFTILFLGTTFFGSAQTYMYITGGEITPESPVAPTDVVSINLTGDFSDTGGMVDDYTISLDGFTVNLEINASSEGGATVLTPFDITYELGTYDVGVYTVEITGTGIGVSIEGPLTFEVVDETDNIPEIIDEPEFMITPNPSSDILMVKDKNWESHSRIELVSAESKIALKQAVLGKYTELDIANLEAGVYILLIIDNNGVVVEKKKVVIAH